MKLSDDEAFGIKIEFLFLFLFFAGTGILIFHWGLLGLCNFVFCFFWLDKTVNFGMGCKL